VPLAWSGTCCLQFIGMKKQQTTAILRRWMLPNVSRRIVFGDGGAPLLRFDSQVATVALRGHMHTACIGASRMMPHIPAFISVLIH